MNFVEQYLREVCRILQNLSHQEIEQAISMLKQAKTEGKKIFVMGNGGSAAMASHFACDLGKGTVQKDKARFKVISLNDNIPLLTAYANDCGYETVFSEPLTSLAEPDDIAIAISSSGNSLNVLKAVDAARDLGLKTIGIAGYEKSQLKEKVDLYIQAGADKNHPNSMQHAEDGQWVILHAIFVAIWQEMQLS